MREEAEDMASFGASHAACFLYPGVGQQAERAAFCAGAAYHVGPERHATLQRISLLERVLRDLENANDAVCGARTQQQYLDLIDSGQKDLLSDLDDARSAARAALTKDQPKDKIAS